MSYTSKLTDWGSCIHIYMGRVWQEIILKTLSLGDGIMDGFNFLVVLYLPKSLQ